VGGTNISARMDHNAVYRLIMAGWGSQIARALARLSVAEALAKGPATAVALAESLGSHPDMTYRLLRAARALGFVDFDARTGRFSATALLDILHQENAMSLKHYAQAVGSEAFWSPSRLLTETVMRGQNCAADVLGCDPFVYFASHPEEAQIFSAAMTELSAPVIAEAVPLIEIGEARDVMDIGGAAGTFVASVLRAHPALRGTVLDLPHVVADVAREAERQGVADRMTAIAGDFFDEIPPASLYLVKFVLHDWDDDACLQILGNIARAMTPDARLIIVEMATDEMSLDASLMDVGMMFAFTGREREVAEFDILLKSAELRIVRTHKLQAPYVLIEAARADVQTV